MPSDPAQPPMARRLSASFDAENVALHLQNDDDAERSAAKRVKHAEAARRAAKARSPFKETPRHQAKTAAITTMYNDAIQMCAENKVNEKNSWNLDLIDHMGRMIETQPAAAGDDEMTNFQLASSTLDAGVKIYAYRVDSVYNETFKLIGGLNRTAKRDGADYEAEADGAAEGAADDETGGAAEPKKRARRTTSSTDNLEPNPANLDLKKLELSFEVDPLFHRTSAKFDAGGAHGLLLHNTCVREGCQLAFDSSAVRAPIGGDAPAHTETQQLLPRDALAGCLPAGYAAFPVCAELASYAQGLRSGVSTDDYNAVAPAEMAAEEGEDAASDAASDDGGESHHADDGDGADFAAPSSPPADWSAAFAPADDDELDLDASVQAREAALLAQADADAEDSVAFWTVDELAERGNAASVDGTASDVDRATAVAQRLLQVGQRWAGPAHWKFRAQPSAAAAAGNKKRAGRAPFLLDFSRGAEAVRELEAAALDARGTTLSDTAIAKERSANNTLPRDMQCGVEVLSTLFHRPATRIGRRKLGNGGASLPAAVSSHGASSSQCDANVRDDDEGGGFDDSEWSGDLPDAAADGAQSEAVSLELVEQPRRVEKIDIGYARVAKKVDIKKLKGSIGELLDDGFGGANVAEERTAELSFQQVVSRVPNKVAESERADVSFAYCFICLLHIANERGLEIEGDASMTDLRVRSGA